MKFRYRLFRRGSGIFFLEDRLNRKQESLKTRDKTEAIRMLHARNEATQQPAINLQIARAYLMASDPLVAKRTWDDVMEAIIKLKQGPTRERYERARKEKPMERIRRVRLIETQAEHFLAAPGAGVAWVPDAAPEPCAAVDAARALGEVLAPDEAVARVADAVAGSREGLAEPWALGGGLAPSVVRASGAT